ncbi:hypothetical protein CPC08DRAFT_752496 [Agrocybe pediades]|nr:hypothetical protein CPC08DRAFT_752496 [Agrocybe pediades]
MPTASSLPRDILWNIFCIIGCSFAAAVTTCSAWRDTLIHSPSIWAICLLFDELELTSEAWKSEVVRRTGSDALLHVVRQRERKRFDANDEWFYRYLRDNWHRIHILDINIAPTAAETYLEIQNLPASNLVECRWGFSTNEGIADRPYSQNPTSVVAFGGGAPLLRRFMVLTLPNRSTFYMPVHIPPLQQLRSLKICPVHEEIRLLEALSSASLLETLTLSFRLGNKSEGTDAVARTTVSLGLLSLPSLKELEVMVLNDFPASIRFLNQLDMRHCRFTLGIHLSTEAFLDPTEMSSLVAVLASYLRHFEGRPETDEEQFLSLDADMTLPLQIPAASLRSVTLLILSAEHFEQFDHWGQLSQCAELLPALEEVRVWGVVDENKDEVLKKLREFADSRVSCGAKPINATYSFRRLDI